MSTQEMPGHGTALGPDQAELSRIRLLMSTRSDQSHTDSLRLALHQAVAGLGGLGGMAHLRVPSDDRPLRLMATTGLPREFAQQWETLGWHDDVAPVRALREKKFVWLAAVPEPQRWLPPRSGIAAVPLLTDDGSLGTLSVVTVAGPPSGTRRAFLTTLAHWAAQRLAHAAPTPAGPSPTWWNEDQVTGTRLQEALKAVRVGSWDWDLRTGDGVWDDATLIIFGIEPGTRVGRIDEFVEYVHPEDLPHVVSALERAVREHTPHSVEYRVCRPDGTVGWVEARGQVMLDDAGEPARMVGTVWDTTHKRMALDAVGRSLRHLSDGFLTTDADWRIEFVNLQAETILGPAQELFSRVLWDIPSVRAAGLEQRCRKAAATGTPTGFDIRWPATHRWYHLRLVPGPEGSTVYFTDVTDKRRADKERAAARRAAARRTAHVGQLNEALAEAVTMPDVVTIVAERVLPLFDATGLFVQLVAGDSLVVAGSSGYTEDFLACFPTRTPLTVSAPHTEAVRTRAPQYIESRGEFHDRYPGLSDVAFSGGKHAWAFLPLIVSGRPVGCLAVSFPKPREFSDEDRALLTALSGLIAQALERARLYDAAYTRAQELQRGLLPQTLPSPPAVTAAALYVPAADGADVGGDWYDVIPLSADRVALVIGDVMGHGLAEAATMGRLRTALHTLAGLELPPDELLSHLNDLVSDLGDDFFATCLYAVYDPTTHVCTLASAGQPPPALVQPDGTVRFVDLPRNPPLGAATPPFETVELTVPEESLLVLYTDGLVESALRDIDSGMALMADALGEVQRRAQHPGSAASGREPDKVHLGRLCTELTSTLVPAEGQTNDDAAVLVARTHALAAENVAVWDLPEDPVAAGQARSHVRDRLADWRLDDLVMVTELIVSELVGNVIRHARGPIRLRLIRSRSLICEVTDGSLTTPHVRRAIETDEGGRGLQLVAALSQRWGTRYTAQGKSIWTEQPLPDPSRDAATGVR
ncbi:SpoIIE family protein phosphatase [Streptomyces fuscichromogenes]|nr:SpoIIE family protein phosphatase [Streptomyces fuscichromogenes]